jgi:dTDP-4-amino-4,6-dideoxygalactose transaminase
MKLLSVANPHAQYLAHKQEIDHAIQTVLEGGRYVLGECVEIFEREFAAYLDVEHVVALNSGTDALVIALRILGSDDRNEVIVPSMTASPTVAAIMAAGCIPRFADVDPTTHTINPGHARRLIGPRTRAIIAVHLYGCPADLASLRSLCDEHSVALVEDCAQSCGARYGERTTGTLGDIGCFSFFPTKNLGALGDGGALATRNPVHAGNAARMRQYGWDAQRNCQSFGINSRLDEIQAAILRVKLQYLDRDNQYRSELANTYRTSLEGLPLEVPGIPEGAQHAFHLFVILVNDRDRLIDALAKQGIVCAVHYRTPTHRMPAFSQYASEDLPMSDMLAKRALSLPMYPELEMADVQRTCKALRACIPSSAQA